MSTFDFGHASDLYARNIHPRLMLGPAEILKLRRRTRAGEGKLLLQALRKKVKPFIRQILADDAWRGLLTTGKFFWPSRATVLCIQRPVAESSSEDAGRRSRRSTSPECQSRIAE